MNSLFFLKLLKDDINKNKRYIKRGKKRKKRKVKNKAEKKHVLFNLYKSIFVQINKKIRK